jgi:hypothetical protein
MGSRQQPAAAVPSNAGRPAPDVRPVTGNVSGDELKRRNGLSGRDALG